MEVEQPNCRDREAGVCECARVCTSGRACSRTCMRACVHEYMRAGVRAGGRMLEKQILGHTVGSKLPRADVDGGAETAGAATEEGEEGEGNAGVGGEEGADGREDSGGDAKLAFVAGFDRFDTSHALYPTPFALRTTPYTTLPT